MSSCNIITGVFYYSHDVGLQHLCTLPDSLNVTMHVRRVYTVATWVRKHSQDKWPVRAGMPACYSQTGLFDVLIVVLWQEVYIVCATGATHGHVSLIIMTHLFLLWASCSMHVNVMATISTTCFSILFAIIKFVVVSWYCWLCILSRMTFPDDLLKYNCPSHALYHS